MAEGGRRFRLALAAITVVGLAWRVIYVMVSRRHAFVWGDAFYYHNGANLLADGHGFIEPADYLLKNVKVEAADHPPIYMLYLTAFTVVGLRSATAHLLASCLIGAATIAVTGLAGRAIAGARVGLIAAALVAIYPNIWSEDTMLQSETVALLAVATTVLLAYRYWHRPSLARAAALGAVVGLAALSRAELLLLSVLVIAPLVLLATSLTRAARARHLALAAVVCVGVLAPWVGYNLSRFEKPVYLSSGFEITLASGTCDRTYYGEAIGYWNIYCVTDILDHRGLTLTNSDESTRAAVYKDESVTYIRNHLDRLPAVLLARWGRITGLYRPLQQAGFDVFPEGRDKWVAYTSLGNYYVLAVLAVFGVRTLRRRHIPVFPLIAPIVTVFVSVTLTFAQNRYRASAEGVLCLLAAVAIDAAIGFIARARREDTPVESPQPPPRELVTAAG